MYQQLTYEEARHHDAHRAAHASDPTWSDFRRRRPLRRWFASVRDRLRDDVIDLRSPVPGMPTIAQQIRSGPGVLPEFIDVSEGVPERIELAPES